MSRPRHTAKCTVDDCEKLATKRGMCDTHYHRLRRTGAVDDQPIRPNRRTRLPEYELPPHLTRDQWLAWAAGFFDGEGYAGFSLGNKRPGMSSRLTVVNRSRSSVEIFQALFGGTIRQKTRAWNTPDNHADTYYWELRGFMAAHAVREMLPYLHVKRPQVEILLEFEDHRERGGRGRKLSDAEIARREKLRLEITCLNKRGREHPVA